MEFAFSDQVQLPLNGIGVFSSREELNNCISNQPIDSLWHMSDSDEKRANFHDAILNDSTNCDTHSGYHNCDLKCA